MKPREREAIVELMGRNTTIAEITTALGLDQFINISAEIRPSVDDMTKIRADVFEALLAAYWKEFGPTEGHRIITAIIEPICVWMWKEMRADRLWPRKPLPRR
ncbi:hypothetical protein Q8F55_004551 [Vanrija albida]|uniref:Uncharacterized protein n=1 Tax=Vanrija albida TaxID=181172 RepID=A0ABR3Q875_9TREE